MSEKKVVRRSVAITLGIACILLVASISGIMAYYTMTINNRNSSYNALSDYKDQLETWLAENITQLQSQLDLLNTMYQNYISNHSYSNSDYDSLTDYTRQLETWLAENITQYNNYVSDHHYTDEQYASENASSYQYGYDTGYNTGYTKGLNDGAGHGFTVRDPTYQEMLNFIASDQTDKSEYNTTSYVCWNFAGDVKNNAFKVGYKCGFVYIAFPDSAHGIVCFKTIDKGLVFIEPQDDAIVSMVIGQHYWDRTKYIVLYDDTIVSFSIIW